MFLIIMVCSSTGSFTSYLSSSFLLRVELAAAAGGPKCRTPTPSPLFSDPQDQQSITNPCGTESNKKENHTVRKLIRLVEPLDAWLSHPAYTPCEGLLARQPGQQRGARDRYSGHGMSVNLICSSKGILLLTNMIFNLIFFVERFARNNLAVQSCPCRRGASARPSVQDSTTPASTTPASTTPASTTPPSLTPGAEQQSTFIETVGEIGAESQVTDLETLKGALHTQRGRAPAPVEDVHDVRAKWKKLSAVNHSIRKQESVIIGSVRVATASCVRRNGLSHAAGLTVGWFEVTLGALAVNQVDQRRIHSPINLPCQKDSLMGWKKIHCRVGS